MLQAIFNVHAGCRLPTPHLGYLFVMLYFVNNTEK